MSKRQLQIVVSCLFTAWAIVGCASRPEPSLSVAAASSLSPMLTELLRKSDFDPPFQVVASYSSTGNLAQQIANGAPFDLFLAADEAHMDDLIEGGFIIPESVAAFATGRLVVIYRPDLGVGLNRLEDLARPELHRIAIANPLHAPYGQAAMEVLTGLGLWDRLESKVVLAETVRQAAILVETGNADAGIVAQSVADVEGLLSFTVPESLHRPIIHTLGVIADADHPDLASRFIDYMSEPESQAVIHSFGFNASPDLP
jgi:molybdate transport system substrate-binding protein